MQAGNDHAMWKVAFLGCLIGGLVGFGETATRSSPQTQATLLVELPRLTDLCFFRAARRPTDCAFASRPECMYADALLRIERAEGKALQVTASPYEEVWEGAGLLGGPRASVSVSAASPEEAAGRLPQMLRALRMPPRPIAQTCVGVIADQSRSIGEVVAFHNELEALGLRKVGYFPMQAED